MAQLLQQPEQQERLHSTDDNVTAEILKSITALNDRIFEFRHPTTLYGRDKEQEQVSVIYNRFLQRLRQPSDQHRDAVTVSEFILIHGATGIGKSAFVDDCFGVSKQKKFGEDACFCMKGEFDQRIHLRKPNTAFIDILTSYIVQIKERNLIDRFRSVLHQSSFTNEEIDTLIAIVPDLSELFDRMESSINIQRSDKIVSAASFQNSLSNDIVSSFKYALIKFLRVMATSTYPIVVVLEDIHRADESALNLLLFIVNHSMTNAILFVGTTRDDVDSEGLEIMLSKISFQKVDVAHIRLNNLEPSCATTMISDMLGLCNDDKALLDMLDTIVTQTMCNPYCIFVYLLTFVENGRLCYVDSSSGPSWQLGSNNDHQFDNKTIGDMITDKLALLPMNVLQLLRFAAFFWTKFDLEILVYLMNETEPAVLLYLNVAVSNGFLCIRPSGDFSFAHEFVQETLIQSVQGMEREEFQYRAGRRLWQCYDIEKLDENIFVVVTQLLAGQQFIVNERERVAVARLCLRSCEQSVYISSFRSAFSYVLSGINLLGSNCWHDDYLLSLDLHNAAAELAYCTGKGCMSLDIANTIANNVRCFEDALTGHDVQVRALGAVGRVQEGIDFGLKVLLNLGESFPTKPSSTRCIVTLHVIRKRLKGRTSESLLRLPLMKDRRKTAAVTMMNQLFTMCIQCRPLLAPLLVSRVICLTIDFGISATSCIGFVALGAILSGPVQDIEEGYRLGQVGMSMYDKFKVKVWLAPLTIMYYVGIHSFNHTLLSVVEPLRFAAQIGEETGNIEESMVCELVRVFIQLGTRPLLKTLGSISELRRTLQLRGLTTLHELSIPMLQYIETLTECRDMDTMKKYQEGDGLIFIYYDFLRMVLSYMFGDTQEVVKRSKHLRLFSAYPLGSFDASFVVFYDGLVAIRQARNVMKRRNIRYGIKKLRQLTTYAKFAPDLFLCRICLLEAEIAAIKGFDFAHAKYITSIALAKHSGSVSVAAHGCELAGRYFLHDKQDLLTAKKYFQEAINYFELWGATSKVTQLTDEVNRIFG